MLYDIEVGTRLALPIVFDHRESKVKRYRELTVVKVTQHQAQVDTGEQIRLSDGYVIGSAPLKRFVFKMTSRIEAINHQFDVEREARIEANRVTPDEEDRMKLAESLVGAIEFGDYPADLLQSIMEILDQYDAKKLIEQQQAKAYRSRA